MANNRKIDKCNRLFFYCFWSIMEAFQKQVIARARERNINMEREITAIDMKVETIRKQMDLFYPHGKLISNDQDTYQRITKLNLEQNRLWDRQYNLSRVSGFHLDMERRAPSRL
jgi:hypothetical protein